ncbi:hypothetical protein [Clostridium thermobutyricum]|uniref:hypothetical protein n=1 Tax=Clostridium thermobutyricum TaxID=29372 RepID=UPI0018A90223|nr:hypothetical protein [Clostridium thermobutyricum]
MKNKKNINIEITEKSTSVSLDNNHEITAVDIIRGILALSNLLDNETRYKLSQNLLKNSKKSNISVLKGGKS